MLREHILVCVPFYEPKLERIIEVCKHEQKLEQRLWCIYIYNVSGLNIDLNG